MHERQHDGQHKPKVEVVCQTLSRTISPVVLVCDLGGWFSCRRAARFNLAAVRPVMEHSKGYSFRG